MSVLINGWTMPDCCGVCPCNDDDWRCGALGRTFDDIEDECGNDTTLTRPSICPLVEVPEPHGRLIDADEYQKKICTYNETGCGSCEYQTKCPADAPTVIEAEEQEHEESHRE